MQLHLKGRVHSTNNTRNTHHIAPSPALYRSLAGSFRTDKRYVSCQTNLGDDLLDYVTAGPKLRKWYGQGERLPNDGGPQKDQEPEEEPEDEVKDAVLVTDADGATGELVLLQLILNRVSIKAIVKDVQDAERSYGPYVKAGTADVSNGSSLVRALKGVRALVCLGKTGALLPAAKQAGVEHVVLLSMAGTSSGGGFDLSGIFGGEDSALKDAAREAAVAQSGLAYTIIRAGKILSVPGGSSKLKLTPCSSSSSSSPQGISREDLALVIAQALQNPPQQGQGLLLLAEGAGPGAAPADWEQVFQGLMQQGTAA